jgi:hypothetical protein
MVFGVKAILAVLAVIIAYALLRASRVLHALSVR